MCEPNPDGTIFNFDLHCVLGQMCACAVQNDIARNTFDIAPYLYPFTIEFNILIVGIWYIMWSNVGNIGEHRSSLDFMPASRRDSLNSSVSNDDNTSKPNAFLYADCHGTNRGLFGGLSVVVLTLTVFIIFAILAKNCDTGR